jgi:hypothetical protein
MITNIAKICCLATKAVYFSEFSWNFIQRVHYIKIVYY